MSEHVCLYDGGHDGLYTEERCYGYVFLFFISRGRHRVVFRRRGAFKTMCVFVTLGGGVGGGTGRVDAAAGGCDDDAGDGDARRGEDVDATRTRERRGARSVSFR